jgi:pyruvate dehydrogenase E2 component (dihydrolipoamide acetyltransferase)
MRSYVPPMADPGVKGETRSLEPSRAERTLGRRAAESRATIPDLELGAEVEMTAAVELVRRRGCSPTAILVRACALALRDVPTANGSYRDGRYELHSRINIGVVVAGGEIQLTPTLFDADGKELEELDAELQTLTNRARDGELTSPELSGATFTVADLGPLGVDRPGIVIPGGHAAAVAAGTIRDAPVIRDGAIVPGHVMALTLVCDHRILYGTNAARFLTRIKELLQEGNL